jgi:cytoskeleton protein RodZ
MTETAPVVPAGERLRFAREALGWSVQDIAARLHLGERQIAALEAGDYKALPERTFVRGFVRNYARLVDLDPLPLLELLDEAKDLKSPRLELPESTHIVLPLRERALKGKRLDIAVALLVVLLVAIAIHLSPYDFSSNPASATDGETPPILPITPALPEETPQEPSQTPPDAANGTQTAPQTEETLHFHFLKSSWVEVRDRESRIVARRTFAQGETREITGVPPFNIIIGNAAFVELSFRGAPVSLKPGLEGIARLTLQ